MRKSLVRAPEVVGATRGGLAQPPTREAFAGLWMELGGPGECDADDAVEGSEFWVRGLEFGVGFHNWVEWPVAYTQMLSKLSCICVKVW